VKTNKAHKSKEHLYLALLTNNRKWLSHWYSLKTVVIIQYPKTTI